MSTHKAYVLKSVSEPLALATVQTPTPTSGQILLKVLAVPTASYTRQVINGTLKFPLAAPFTPGPSAIARVSAIGPDTTSLKVGQLVYVDPTVRARDGEVTMLLGWMAGVSRESRKLAEEGWRDGSWAEKMIAPLENVFALDEEALIKERGYTPALLSKIVTFLVPYGGYESANLQAGETVITAFATGAFGGASINVALAMGAGKVIAIVRSKASLEAVQKTYSNESSRVSVVVITGDSKIDGEALKAATPRGAGAEIFLDLSPPAALPTSSSLLRAGISALKTNGRLVLMGGIDGDISLPYRDIMHRNIEILGKWMYTPQAPARVIALIESGRIELEGFDVETFKFEDLEKAIDRAGVASNYKTTIALIPNEE